MLSSIQAGRALAALAVAAFHLSLLMGAERYGGVPVFREFTNRGDLGVDFFFVLSGFVILMAHHADIGKPQRLYRYAWKRWARVYPIYLLYTAGFTALVFAGFGNNTPMPSTAQGWLTTLTLVRFSADSPPLAPAWTLFHEVGFYAMFGVLILSKRIGLLIFAVWGAVALLLFSYPPEFGRTAGAVYLSAYAFHFMLGMGAFLVVQRLGTAGWRTAFSISGALIACSVAWIIAANQAPLLAWAVGFAGVLVAATTAEKRFAIHAPQPLRLIGDASYTLYLLHLPLQGLLLKIAQRVHLPDAIGPHATFIAVLALTTALSCVAYLVIEKPMLRRIAHGSIAVTPASPHLQQR